MQMLQHPRIGLLYQECLIGVDTIPGQQGSARRGDVSRDVGKEGVGGGGGGGGRGAHGGREARAFVRVDAPLRHVREDCVWGVDDCFEGGCVEEV